MMHMLQEAEFWVAVGFVVLMGVFGYIGVHKTVLTALDHRRDRIKAELDDARRLKDEAAKLLAEYKARHAAAERDGDDGGLVFVQKSFQPSDRLGVQVVGRFVQEQHVGFL